MSNEVEIKVKSTDNTNYDRIKAKSKSEFSKAGDESGKSFGTSLKRWFTREGPKAGEDGGRRSGKGFGAGMKKWFVGEGGGLFKQIGENGGTVFGSGLLGAIKTPILGPAILGIIGGAVATALPAVGAIAAGGIVAGFGAGIAGIGLVLAAKSKQVQDKWSATMESVGERSKLMAKPFEATLIGIADIFDRTVAHFEPTVTRVFAKLARPVEDFAGDVGVALEGLIPAIEPVGDAFDAVLDSLGPGLQDMIADLSDGMQDLAASVKENPDALADTARAAGDLLKTGLGLVSLLNDVNGEFEQLTGGTSAVELFFGGIQSSLMPLVGLVEALEAGLDGLNDLTKPVGDGFHYTATSAEEAATAAGFWTQGMSAAQLAAMGITGATKGAGKATESLADKISRQKAKTDALIQSLFKLQNGYLTLAGAQIEVQAAIDAGTQSVKDNGKTLDINTEKGRNNKQALIDLAKAVNEQTESMIRNNKGTTAAALAAEKSRANFIKLAQQMGATKPQAEAMAKSMIGIPNVTRTARLQANKKDLEAKLAKAKKELADPNLTKERKAELKANIANLLAGIKSANAKLASVPTSRTVTITTRMVTEKIVRQQTTAITGGHATGHWRGGTVMPGLARGGSPLSAREFMAGEYGKEIVKVDGTGNVSVTPAGNTARRMGQQGSGPAVVQLMVDTAGSQLDQFLVRILQRAVQARGGNVQLVFGGRSA